MIDQGKNVLIGVFVLAAIGVFVWVLMFLHPTVGDAGKVLRVRFSDIDKVSLGTRVSYAGKPVGEVVDIILLEDARSGPPDQLGRVYMYELVCLVDTSVHVYSTDDVTIYTSGLLGERSIAINPIKPRPGDPVKLLDNQVIYAKGSGSVEDAFDMIRRLSAKAEVALDEFTNLLETNNEDLNRAIKSARRTLDNFDLTVSRINDTDLVGGLNDAAAQFGDSMSELKTQLAQLEEREIWDRMQTVSENVESITTALNQPEKLMDILDNVHVLSDKLIRLENKVETSWDGIDSAIDDLQVTLANAREMTEDGKTLAADAKGVMEHISRGRGSLGRILKSDDFYLKVNALMTKAEVLMNDINHYGLLFHLDKSWQRERTKRANDIASLKTADQFRTYFDQEVDRINTSLTRVSVILKEADYKSNREEMLKDREFTEVFSDLMRRVENLEQTLRYYNEMLQQAG